MMCQVNVWLVIVLGEINIQMYGNIVDFICVVEGSDSDKIVMLGIWLMKQFSIMGSCMQFMFFMLKLIGCLSGLVLIMFFGKIDGSDSGLLVLNDVSMVNNVVVEIRDVDKICFVLQQVSQLVVVDVQGNVVLLFYVNYIVIVDNFWFGCVDVDVIFMINYNQC